MKGQNYVFIKNPFNSNAPFNSCMFETFGEEFDYVCNYDVKKVWTIIDEGGVTFIISGLHYANRLGYLISTESAKYPDESCNL